MKRKREGQFLLRLMEQRFRRPFLNYWEQFGYEIGGPVCYSFIEWIHKILRERTDVTDILFVARDGWLLKQIYESLSQVGTINSHYVYAPRTFKLACQNTEEKEAYRTYLDGLGIGNGTVAVVDTVTMKFSSQGLLSSMLQNRTIGLYWLVLHANTGYAEGFAHECFQKKDYHMIRCWNLMEFIMTSPEPSIRAINNGMPVYRNADASELEREELFFFIEKGVLSFVEDVKTAGNNVEIGNPFITQWVNDFLKHPSKEDEDAFQGIIVSESEDHSDRILMNPFQNNIGLFSLKEMKDKLWHYSQRHKKLYKILHWGKSHLTNMVTIAHLHGGRSFTFDGTNPEALIEKLGRYDVISFDIFDTLIIRSIQKPTDLFAILEKKSGLCGFYDARIRAEADARQKQLNGEITISDIYNELALYYEQDMQKVLLQEIEEEKNVCYADEAIKRLFKMATAHGIRIIAVSDMYLPQQVLRELLDSCGYDNIERVFVSCEYGSGKANGRLQRIVQQELGSELRFIHIGDNRNSDVYGSIAAGWDAIWYRRKG